MDRERASQLAIEWIGAHGEAEQQMHETYDELMACLRSLMPDSEHAAVLVLQGNPIILMIGETQVWTVHAHRSADTADQTGPTVTCNSRALDPARASASVTETVKNAARRRQWTFDFGDGHPALAITTERLGAGFLGDHGRSAHKEEVVSELARRLGWEIPDPDPTGPEL